MESHAKLSGRVSAIALICLALGAARCQRGDNHSDTGALSAAPAAEPPALNPATHPAAAPPAPTPALITQTFEDKKNGVQLQYTSNWAPKSDPDWVLQIVPADGSTGRRIVFDIPDLPPHFPGMIRLGLIENGYVNDLKDKHKDLHVDHSADFPMSSGAKARLVESSWTENGAPHKNVAVLAMRNDHVYILACGSDPAHLPATRADFDKFVASLQWSK